MTTKRGTLDGGGPTRSFSVRPITLHYELAEILEQLSKKWDKSSDRLCGHFFSSLILVYYRIHNNKIKIKNNKEFISALDKAHTDIESKQVTDVKTRL